MEAMGPRDPMIVFAYACLRHEYGALLAQQPTGGAAPDSEAIHRMRIATRRLRVALRTFANMLPEDRAREFAKAFRWFAQALGEVRDLDVYAENFRDYAKLVPPEQQPELGGYELHLRRARTAARNDLDKLFADPRVAELLDGFRGFLEGAPPAPALRRWRSFRVGDGAAKYLRKSMKRVLRGGRKITAESEDEKLHRLRIRAKRLRYELEFFAEVFPELAKAVKATKQLQEVLGEHQDACTASARLCDYAREHEPKRVRPQAAAREPSALERLRSTQEHKAADARQRFASEWQRFERAIDRVKLKKLAA
jgi:CHAD domain-containing protein